MPIPQHYMCEEVCPAQGRQTAVIRFTPNTSLVEYSFCSPGDISSEQQREVYLHVDTVMLAGTLMLLLMTANTLMLYSTPASRSEMVQAVVLPGILISNGTPDRERERQRKTTGVHYYALLEKCKLGALRPPPALLGV